MIEIREKKSETICKHTDKKAREKGREIGAPGAEILLQPVKKIMMRQLSPCSP